MPQNQVRSNFVKTTREVIVYREQEEGYAEDPVRLGVGNVFHIAVETESMVMNGKNVEAVLFTIGGSPGWFWMPKPEFVKSTTPHDIKTQTGIPFQA